MAFGKRTDGVVTVDELDGNRAEELFLAARARGRKAARKVTQSAVNIKNDVGNGLHKSYSSFRNYCALFGLTIIVGLGAGGYTKLEQANAFAAFRGHEASATTHAADVLFDAPRHLVSNIMHRHSVKKVQKVKKAKTTKSAHKTKTPQ